MANFLTPEQQRMIAQQQAAAGGGYGAIPQQQMMAQQQQQQMMAQQYSSVGTGAPAGTTIAVNLSDGCLIGYDRLRNVLILNGKTSNITLPHGQVPARPTLSSVQDLAATSAAEAAREPVTKCGIMTKLGFKKGLMGAESWQKRHFTLTADALSYSKDSGGSAISSIPLHRGLRVGVVNANSPARRDRFEDGDHSMSSMMTKPIGAMMSETSGYVGKDFCVELVCPPQVGDMLGSVMNNSAVGLAFGGGMKDLKKAQARTYYMQCSTESEAQQWRDAIQNNINCLAQPELPSAGSLSPTPGGGYAGVNMSGLNNAMNYATSMQQSMQNASDPSKSLQWYKDSLGTAIALEELFASISSFYDQLDAAGIPHR